MKTSDYLVKANLYKQIIVIITNIVTIIDQIHIGISSRKYTAITIPIMAAIPFPNRNKPAFNTIPYHVTDNAFFINIFGDIINK